jgi:hypothetical protein
MESQSLIAEEVKPAHMENPPAIELPKFQSPPSIDPLKTEQPVQAPPPAAEAPKEQNKQPESQPPAKDATPQAAMATPPQATVVAPENPPKPVIATIALQDGHNSASKFEAKKLGHIASSAPMLDVVVVIPTVRRFQSDGSPAPERYLEPMVEKLWSDLSAAERDYVKIFILNGDKEPNEHVEALGLQFHPAVTLFTKRENMTEVLKDIPEWSPMEDGRVVSDQWMTWVASENVDAAYLMDKAKKLASYVLFLEDDIQPTTHALRKLTRFVKDMESLHDDWLFLDLYTPNLDWGPGMLDVETGKKYPFQCCTQAMLFRYDRIDGVINYLRAHPKEPIDDNLRFYMKNIAPNLVVYPIRPNLFEHVGAYSSNPAKSHGTVEHTSLDFEP